MKALLVRRTSTSKSRNRRMKALWILLVVRTIFAQCVNSTTITCGQAGTSRCLGAALTGRSHRSGMRDGDERDRHGHGLRAVAAADCVGDTVLRQLHRLHVQHDGVLGVQRDVRRWLQEPHGDARAGRRLWQRDVPVDAGVATTLQRNNVSRRLCAGALFSAPRTAVC